MYAAIIRVMKKLYVYLLFSVSVKMKHFFTNLSSNSKFHSNFHFYSCAKRKKNVLKEYLAVSAVLPFEYLNINILIIDRNFTYIIDQLSIPNQFTYMNSENYANLDNFFNYFRINWKLFLFPSNVSSLSIQYVFLIIFLKACTI